MRRTRATRTLGEFRRAFSTPVPCEFRRCHGEALPLSSPARCIKHIDNVDLWCSDVLKDVPGPPDSLERIIAAQYVKSTAAEVCWMHPWFAAVYEDFKEREDRRPNVHFKFSDAAHFVLYAAAAGIVGNLAWTLVRRLAVGLVRPRLRRAASSLFHRVMPRERYDALRSSKHGKVGPRNHATRQFREKLTRKGMILLFGAEDFEAVDGYCECESQPRNDRTPKRRAPSGQRRRRPRGRSRPRAKPKPPGQRNPDRRK